MRSVHEFKQMMCCSRWLASWWSDTWWWHREETTTRASPRMTSPRSSMTFHLSDTSFSMCSATTEWDCRTFTQTVRPANDVWQPSVYRTLNHSCSARAKRTLFLGKSARTL